MLEKLFAAGRAINAGESLANPATWKNRQLAANALLVVLGAIAAFVPNLGVSHEDLQAIAAGIAATGGLLNAYLTAATSTKVGLPPRGGGANPPAQPDQDNLGG